jgi:hypothetical protein
MQRLCLCVPAMVRCAADGFLTLASEPVEYWSGDFATVREGHAVAAWFLSLHPLAFAAAGVPYLLLVVTAVMWLPRRGAAVVAGAGTAGHTIAVTAWCWILFAEHLLALPIARATFAGLGVLAWKRGWRGTVEPRAVG